jgi:integrase
LHWNQIDFEKRAVTVGRAKTQAGTGRLIPLNQPAFEALAKWAGRLVESRPEDYVFPACEAAGIERKHPDRERIDPFRGLSSLGAMLGVLPSSGRPSIALSRSAAHMHYEARGVSGQRAHAHGHRWAREP